MDPFTATSLAGSIVQFVEFASKVVSKGHRIYHSADGSLAENNDLELVTNDLLILQTKLEERLPKHHTACDDDDEDAIRKLASASNTVAKELLQRLQMVKVQGRFRKWNSLRQAVKSVWSKNKVDEMAARLNTFREEIQARMILSVSSQIDENHKLMTEIGAKVGRIQSDIDSSNLSSAHPGPPSYEWRKGESLTSLVKPLTSTEEDVHHPDKLIVKGIVKAFSYHEQSQRHESIPYAYATTFRWVIEDHSQEQVPWDNLLDWLHSENHLYWIRGKAASGKSTLMKFVIKQEKVHKALEEWALPKKLIKVDFFFWALGTPIQQSQQGLLLSIIRQIIEQCQPSAVRSVVPELWESIKRLSEHAIDSLEKGWQQWRLEELQHLLDLLLQTISADTKLCIFVDGLDEFSGPHAVIAQFFSDLSRLSNVKCCISSRPLTTIEYEFTGCRGLQLQDLTEGCILAFVRDKLLAHRRFASHMQDEPEMAQKLIRDVVTRSSGVFLWVDLVVRSLLEGLTNHDDPQDLQQRLHDLPPELDALYSTMLRSIQPSFYRTQASRLLQMFYQNDRLVTSIAFSFADEQDPEYVYHADMTPLTSQEAENRRDRITERLKSRCRGLLEVKKHGYRHELPDIVDYPHLPDQVQYLHLTVKEFLEKPEIWSEVISWTAADHFDCNVACAKGLVALVKKTVAFHGWGFHIATLLDCALTYIQQAESSTGESHDRLIHTLEALATQIYPFSDKQHWSSYVNDSYMPHQKDLLSESSNLLQHCITRGLVSYVAKKPSTEILDLNLKVKEGLLTWTMTANDLKLRLGSKYRQLDKISFDHLRSRLGIKSLDSDVDYTKTFQNLKIRSRTHTTYNNPVLPMIKLLFQFGLDPNETRPSWGNLTPWLKLLTWLQSLTVLDRENMAFLIKIVELFVIYGANISTTIPEDIDLIGGKQVVYLLDETFRNAPVHANNSLRQLIAERRAEQVQTEVAARPVSSRSLEDRITSPTNSKRKSEPVRSNDRVKRRRRH